MSGTPTDDDARAALAALGRENPRAITRVTSGLGAAALFRVEQAAGTFALRIFPEGAVPSVTRERAAMAAARAGGLPVPAVEAEGVWRGRPVVLLAWCRGRPMLDLVARQPWRAVALGAQLGRLQARLHTVPITDELRAQRRDWITSLGLRDPVWQERLRAVARGEALLHLDLHPLNVLVDGGRVAALLDWENATIGDPRADLARTWALLAVAPAPPDARGPAIRLVRRALELGWRRGYRALNGWPGDFALFQAWAVEAMVADLARKLGRADLWYGEADLQPLRDLARRLAARTGR